MNTERIAILVDSGNDVPQEYVDQYGIYVIPLSINYSYGTFKDRVNITPQYVYDNFEREVPKTSLPSGEDIEAVLDQIVADGYEKVVMVAISSGLSGTYHMFKLMAEEYKQLECIVVDTKHIGIGAGMIAIYAAQLIQKGVPFRELEEMLIGITKKTHLYFCLSTLDYLKKGGRIGLVSATMGTILGILPVISCNKEGVYYTVKKARGRKNVLSAAFDILVNDAKKYKNYNIAVMHGGAEHEALELVNKLKRQLPDFVHVFQGQISPALVVHTGPGLIGIGVQGI